ncbi:MAG: ankyrin repeat domain-containing protein [Planctomycetota bacterium]
MPGTESFIQTLQRGPLHELVALLDAEPRRMNTFLSEPAPHGDEQWMPMHHAARAGHVAGVEALLERGVHPDCRTRFATPMHARQTPLHLAAAAGHAEVVQRLLEAGAEVEVCDAQQRSPLWLAARHGHAAVVTQLARRGAAVDARDTQQRTPLHAALLPPISPTAAKDLFPGREFALPQGLDILVSGSTSSETTPAFDPASSLALLDAGADPNATCPKDPAGFTPLHRCVTLGEAALAVARQLLEQGGNPTAVDPRHGHTPADLAAQLGLAVYTEFFSA